MSFTKVDYDVAMEVASHEAIIRQTYYDSRRVPTWSVGLTSATGHKVERYFGKPQSLEHCLRVYIWALDNYADEVREVFKGFELTKPQFAGALCFHWNTGKIKTASWPKLLMEGKKVEAEKAFMQYRKPPEIINRRKAEANLIFRGVWSNNGSMTEYTKLTSKGTPDWGSAKRINVSKELRQAIAGEIPDSDKVIVEQVVEKKIPVDVPFVPPAIVNQTAKAVVKSRRNINWAGYLTAATGFGGSAVAWLASQDIVTIGVLLAVGIGGLALALILGPMIIRRIGAILAEISKV